MNWLASAGLSLVVTIVFYVIFLRIYRRLPIAPLHPIIGTSAACLLYMHFMQVDLIDYNRHTQPLIWLLGPATVALAIPLYKQLKLLSRLHWRVLLPIFAGGIIAPIFSWLCIAWLDILPEVKMTMLVKSITTPLAMQTAELIGGLSTLAAILVILTGIVIAVLAQPIAKLVNVHNEMAQGIAMGTVGHAIATAKAADVSQVCLAFASLSLCLNGLVTSLMLPLLF